MRIAALLAAALLASRLAATCTPAPAPVPSPTPTVTVEPPPEPPPVVDAGSAPSADCSGARQFMLELGCPPDEDAFGGWVLECSGWPNAAGVTACIVKQSTCLGTRQCLGK